LTYYYYYFSLAICPTPLHNGRALSDDAVITIHFIVDHTAAQEAHHFIHHYHFIKNIIPDLLT
jgi:hypothetical protein